MEAQARKTIQKASIPSIYYFCNYSRNQSDFDILFTYKLDWLSIAFYSVKVFRCQMPRLNPFYSSEPPRHNGTDKPSGSGGKN